MDFLKKAKRTEILGKIALYGGVTLMVSPRLLSGLYDKGESPTLYFTSLFVGLVAGLASVAYSPILAIKSNSYKRRDKMQKLYQCTEANLEIILNQGTESEIAETLNCLDETKRTILEMQYPQDLSEPVQEALDTLNSITEKYKH